MQSNNDNQNNNQIFYKGKKSQKINDEGPKNKKYLKNQRKKQNKQKLQQQDQDLNKYKKQITQKKKVLTKQEKQLQCQKQLLNVYTECSKQTIRKCLQKANWNMTLAADLLLKTMEKNNSSMMDCFDDFQQSQNNNNKFQQSNESPKYKNKNNNQKNNENKVQTEGYKILNQMYDKAAQIQISGFQFQELFDQITQIIKQDQKSKGKGLIEINNFVQQCMTAKDAILVGLKDIFGLYEDIIIDQNDPIYKQLQQYIYDITTKQVKQQIINAKDFPTLGAANNKKKNNNNTSNKDKQKKPNSPYKQSIINSLQNQNKSYNTPFRKQDLFQGTNNKKPIIFQQKNAKSIFNIDNQQESEDALRGLHKEFSHVSIQSLKITYIQLQRNYNECRIFLTKYYGKQSKQQIKISIQPRQNQRKSSFKRHVLTFQKQQLQDIDQQLQDWNFRQIRDQIEHYYNLRQVFGMTLDKIKNANQRKQLLRIIEQKAPMNLIRKLSKAARVKLIAETIQKNPNYVDLHGHRQEQVGPILQGLIASISMQFDKGNQKVKYKTSGGRTEAIIQIMTGKGRHSLYGKSVLKPCVKKWCDDRKIRAIVNDDNVQIYIPLL